MALQYLLLNENKVVVSIMPAAFAELSALEAIGPVLAYVCDEPPTEMLGSIFLDGVQNNNLEYVTLVMSDVQPSRYHINVGDTWVLSDEEATKQFYELRVGALLNSDWTQLSDAPLTAGQVSEAVTWRQAMRDVTNTSNEPVVWLTTIQNLIDTRPSFIKVI